MARRKTIKDFSGAAVGDSIQNSAYPSSRFWWWLPSKEWWLWRSLPTLFIVGVWSLLIYSLLSFLPLLISIALPIYALPLIAVGAALLFYWFGKPLRSLVEPLYRPLYKFILNTFFAKSESEAHSITEHLAEERSLAQQLVDYILYFFNLRLRDSETENERLKIRIAKFNIRWGAAAKLVLNSFFLTTGTLLFVPLIFGVSLTPAATLGIIAFGIFGGICSSLVAGNLFGNGLIALAKTSVATTEPKAPRTWPQFFDYAFGQLISLAHALAGGAACFSAGMQLVMMLSSFSLIAANPMIIPVLLVFVGLCSLAVARGYYALTRKIWDNKARILKGFFTGTDGDGKPVGSLQRILGFLGAILIGLTISFAFVMLNGTSFANIIQFPLYNLIGSTIHFNLNPIPLAAFSLTGIIGGIGVGIIFFTGIFKLSSDFGRFWDNRLSSQKQPTVVFTDAKLEAEVVEELRRDYGYKEGENEGPQLGSSSWFYRRHWFLERSLRAPIIILMNALATGMLTAVPNVVILIALAPQIAIPIAVTLFAVTAFASLCKDYLNWLPGYENPSHAYEKAKAYLYEAKLIEKNAQGLEELLAEARQLPANVADDSDEEGETTHLNPQAIPRAASSVAVTSTASSTLPSPDTVWAKLKQYSAHFDEIKLLCNNYNVGNAEEIVATLERVLKFSKSQPAELCKRAQALRDGYDPHLYGLVMTGIVRVVSNLFAFILMLTPLVLFLSEDSPKSKRRLSRAGSDPALAVVSPRGGATVGGSASSAAVVSAPPAPAPEPALVPATQEGAMTQTAVAVPVPLAAGSA